jgi:hypothetical protein
VPAPMAVAKLARRYVSSALGEMKVLKGGNVTGFELETGEPLTASSWLLACKVRE